MMDEAGTAAAAMGALTTRCTRVVGGTGCAQAMGAPTSRTPRWPDHGSFCFCFLPCVGDGVSVGYMQYTGNADDALARTSIVGVCGTANACYAAATGAQCSSSR